MQHMLPRVLGTSGTMTLSNPLPPPRQPMQKSVAAAIATALGNIAQPIADIVTAPGRNRTAQELAYQETLRTEMLVADAAARRAHQQKMLETAVVAGGAIIVVYLIFR